MKTAIVYYSMSGNTKYAADKIAEKIEADIIRIEPEKAYPDKGHLGWEKCCYGRKACTTTL